MTIAMVSGGFDPLHVGHLRLLGDAVNFGEVWVALNSDEWLMRKKGYVFMRWGDRRDILSALELVDKVVAVYDMDGTVCGALRQYKPDIFCNGGDRKVANEKEHAVCVELGIEELFNIGGPKIEDSSKLVEAVR